MVEAGVLEYFDVEPALFKRRGPTVSLVERVEERWMTRHLALRRSDRVLDYACGLGRWARVVHSKVRQVVAIDAAPILIRALQQLHLKRVLPLRGSEEQLRRFHGYFDKIIFAQGLEFYRQERPLLRKLYQALAPAGRLYLSTWTPALIKGASGITVAKDAVLVRKTQNGKPIRVFCKFRTKAQVHQGLRKAGFRVVALEVIRMRASRLPAAVKGLFGRKFAGPDRRISVLIVAVAEKPRA